MLHRININVADIRKKPKFKSERRTQALYNEPVELIRKGNKYSYVKLHDGFRGYVNNLFISKAEDRNGIDYTIKSVLTPARSSPDNNSLIITMLPFAAEIKAEEYSDSFILCKCHRYGEFYINKDDLIISSDIPKLTFDKVPAMIDYAMKFMGVPYLWGGRSFFGVDCSGFVNIILKYFGLTMPRKSKYQKNIGKKIGQTEIRPGDLLYFPKHVGIALSPTEYLHSSLSQGGVHINSFDPSRKSYLRYRDLTLKAIRRVTLD